MQLFDRFLKDFEKDRNDGKTVRGLYDALDKHVTDDKQTFGELRAKLTEHGERLARGEEWDEITSTYRKPTSSSKPPRFGELLKKPTAKAIGILLIAIAAAAASHIVTRYAVTPTTGSLKAAP